MRDTQPRHMQTSSSLSKKGRPWDGLGRRGVVWCFHWYSQMHIDLWFVDLWHNLISPYSVVFMVKQWSGPSKETDSLMEGQNKTVTVETHGSPEEPLFQSTDSKKMKISKVEQTGKKKGREKGLNTNSGWRQGSVRVQEGFLRLQQQASMKIFTHRWIF